MPPLMGSIFGAAAVGAVASLAVQAVSGFVRGYQRDRRLIRSVHATMRAWEDEDQALAFCFGSDSPIRPLNLDDDE